MSKQVFIRGSNYGGEYTIGAVTPEFVTYWQGRDEDELVQHLMTLESGEEAGGEEGFDPDSPDILEDPTYYNGWYDIDEIHHMSSSHGTELWAFEVTGENKDESVNYEWDTKIEFQPHSLYSREVYTQDDQQAEDELDDSVPVLTFYSSEKGDFGGWLIDLADGNEFDPNLVAVSQCETDHGEMIERLWYNKVEILQTWNNADSRGKGYYASVAWFNNRWEDPHWNEETDKEMWDEAWEYYDDELQEKRDNLDK